MQIELIRKLSEKEKLEVIKRMENILNQPKHTLTMVELGYFAALRDVLSIQEENK